MTFAKNMANNPNFLNFAKNMSQNKDISNFAKNMAGNTDNLRDMVNQGMEHINRA